MSTKNSIKMLGMYSHCMKVNDSAVETFAIFNYDLSYDNLKIFSDKLTYDKQISHHISHELGDTFTTQLTTILRQILKSVVNYARLQGPTYTLCPPKRLNL